MALTILSNHCISQIIVSGTVYDSTKVYSITGVQVKNTSGSSTVTDSAGMYRINVSDKDSILFVYGSKPTTKFAVSAIQNYNDFDVSLKVGAKEKYKPLKEVVVYSGYRHDSAENRLNYSKIFDYSKPTIRSTYTPGSSAGVDLDELINIFRFRRNKQHLQFQKRLVDQEQERYVDYKFSKRFIKRTTGLDSNYLDKYIKEYKPSYQFITSITELEFYEYITYTSEKFKKDEGI